MDETTEENRRRHSRFETTIPIHFNLNPDYHHVPQIRKLGVGGHLRRLLHRSAAGRRAAPRDPGDGLSRPPPAAHRGPGSDDGTGRGGHGPGIRRFPFVRLPAQRRGGPQGARRGRFRR